MQKEFTYFKKRKSKISKTNFIKGPFLYYARELQRENFFKYQKRILKDDEKFLTQLKTNTRRLLHEMMMIMKNEQQKPSTLQPDKVKPMKAESVEMVKNE